MSQISNSTNSFYIQTISTSLNILDENLTYSLSNIILLQTTNLTISCNQLRYEYISKKSFFKFVRYITDNLNRFFILPALILNLCAFYIIRRTRMNRSSSIAFYMQVLAICDVAFFLLRIIFDELSRLSVNRHILTNSLCKFFFLMVNAVNYTTVWLIAAMNGDKFLAVCLPLRVSDLLSRKKAYAVVITVIICSMLIASIHANRTVLKHNGYCWLDKPNDEKLVFILDAFICCFIPFIVISILNAAIFFALLRARRQASHLHESTTMIMVQTTSINHQLRTSINNRTRIQTQNLQITIMLITISISFFILTLPNAIYYLLIFFRVFVESWKVVECDENVYKNLDQYIQTSLIMHFISHITSDLMHVVNFLLYFISGARFRTEFRRLIFHQLCHLCCKRQITIFGKEFIPNQRSFIRNNGVNSVRSLAIIPSGNIHENKFVQKYQTKQFECSRSYDKNLK